MTFLLYMVADANRRGYRHLIDAFWDEARAFDLALPREEPISAPALCKARKKITTGLLRALLHQVADAFDDRFGDDNRWHGRRVFAVDGTKINLQRSDELRHAFGVPSSGYCPQAMVSTLFDLESKVPHDIVIAPHASCERQQMVLLLDRLKPGDVLVLDRGYPSFEVLRLLIDARIDFVIRVPIGGFAALQDLLYGGTDDRRIRIQPPRDGPMRGEDSISVRALRVTVPGSSPTVLLTSLAQKAFSLTSIAKLYHMRWEVEEFYKLIKSDYLGQRQFHARSAEGIEQEIHAVALYIAVTRLLMAEAAETHDVPYDRLSPKAGTLGLAAYVLRILLACNAERAAPWIEQLLGRIVRTRDKPRPGRRCPRRSFKPLPKWGPAGRRGG